MSKSTLLGGLLDNIKQREDDLRAKEEKYRHQHRNNSTKLSY